MALLIDMTDDAFKIAANEAVIAFIRRANPFAHSNLGTKLIRLARRTPGAAYYCPDFASYAYVAAHTKEKVIFALAFDMRRIALRLPPEARADALAQGGAASEIGADWVSVDAFPEGGPTGEGEARLRAWCEAACRDAEARGAGG